MNFANENEEKENDYIIAPIAGEEVFYEGGLPSIQL